VTVLAALLVTLGAIPERPLDWNALLRSHATDPKLHSVDQRLDLMDDPVSPGWWKKAEIQGEVAGFDRREFNGKLKIQPFGWGERTALREQWSGRTRLLRIQRNRLQGQAQEDRYQRGLEWIFCQRKLAFHRAMHTLYQERVGAHLSLIGTSRFDPQDLVLSQQMVASLSGDLLADQNDLAEIEASLFSMAPGSHQIALDTAELMRPEQLARALEALPHEVDSSFPSIALAQEQVHASERSEQLSAASRRNWIGDVYTGYSNKTEDKLKKTYTLTETEVVWTAGITIPLPFGDTRRLDERRSRLDVMDQVGDLEQVRWETSRKLDQLRMSIGSGLRQIAVCDSFVRKVDAGALFTDFVVQSGSDPLLLLKGRMALLQTQWDLQKLNHDILSDFVRLLELTGRLAAAPERNLLSGRP